MASMAGTLRRIRQSLGDDGEIVEQAQLRHECLSCGGTAIGQVSDRQRVTIVGTVRTATTRPRSSVPALVLEIFDGTGSLTVIWLGRREISGIRPGAYLEVTGRVSIQRNSSTIYNPSYRIIGATERDLRTKKKLASAPE